MGDLLEVWFGEPKADNIVSLGVGRYITSPKNEDVLICINTPFMKQRVFKP
jgi:hypothetical protein